MKIRLLLLSVFSLIASASQAGDSISVVRPVLSAYTVEMGSSHLADTYLTPLRYEGWHLGLGYQRYQAMRFSPERWDMSLNIGLALDRTANPARNSTMWNIALDADWGMMRRYRVIPDLTLAIGASTGINVGAIYNARNGNNPVSAKAAWTVNLTGYASWRVKLWRLPVTLTYRPTLPVTGIFFAPDYGELYYEIYLGDTSGLVHGAWWGDYFSLDNLLTADLVLGATQLRLGYRGKVFSSRVNHITTNVFTHSFVIGISGEWMSINPRRPASRQAKTISALY